MNSLPVKIYLVAIFLFFGVSALAQEKKIDRWSAEFTTGIHVPLAPNYGIARSKYIAFKQFQLAGRYMFTEKFGLKGHYAFNRFANPDDTKMGVSFYRLGMEGVANIGKLLNVDYRLRERFGLLLHTGVGLTFAQPSSVNGTDHIGNVLVGLTGQIRLNNNFTLLGDMTYVKNFAQQYAYNGKLIHANYDYEPGGFVNVSIGIMYNIADGKYHADWY